MMFKNTSEDFKMFAIGLLFVVVITTIGLITASSRGQKETQLCPMEKLVVINEKIYCEISTKKVTEK